MGYGEKDISLVSFQSVSKGKSVFIFITLTCHGKVLFTKVRNFMTLMQSFHCLQVTMENAEKEEVTWRSPGLPLI